MNCAYRTAIAPLRDLPRSRPLPSVAETVYAERPSVPLFCLRPAAITSAAERFVARFPGRVLYAVKCNPEPALLRALWLGGVRDFDAASAAEVELIGQSFPSAGIHFMHPVKARPAIREAFVRHGVMDFAVDSADEMDKVLEEVGGDQGIGLLVRLALPKGGAVWDLSGKFGAAPGEAASLLRRARSAVRRVGLAFHVGSQCLDPAAFERALALAGRVVAEAGVTPDILDVGGGFPVAYDNVRPPEPETFFAAVARGVERLALPSTTELWCEPGRALVAAGQSVVLRVLARRDKALYVNDGIYGSLSDAGPPGFRFPTRPIAADGRILSARPLPFTIFGPTCDSADRLKEPFLLPADIREGDWIEVGQIGAYGTALRTAFNGMDEAMLIEVRDDPLSVSAASADRAA
ncbi:MAG: type III PLP-dependent enzyme [Magnetospirillum sp.]|nr:type III PLP-dependent enzyme [Magnetospirillum sp.]